jgi:membrane-associated phospholipid phosphatase
MMNNIKNYLKHAERWPFSVKIFLSFALFLAASIGFASLADEVREGETLVLDQSILEAIHAGSNDFWNSFFLIVTHLGDVTSVVAITLTVVLFLALKKRYKYILLVVAGVGGAAALNLILKLIFERARPDLWHQLVTETSFSFPSGHAMASAALAFCIAVVFWRSRYRVPVLITALMYVFLIGFSRLYLGVHYPSDVLAGWLMSAAWVLTVIGVIYGWGVYRRSHPLHTKTQ